MADSRNKGRLLLIICGGIAAFKSAQLASLLTQAGVEVQVVMTAAARQFVGPLTFTALTGRATREDMFDPGQEAAIGHIELARWAQAICVAPATADFMAKAALGLADDLASTLLLAAQSPLVLAPAMNPAMWAHPAVQQNAATLKARGAIMVGPAAGRTACGEEGPGRMVEPEIIADSCLAALSPKDLIGVKVLVTAGPTREHLDPVRFLSNPSSGRMGIEVARVARWRGAEVTLVLGPDTAPPPPEVKVVPVVSTEEMQAACREHAAQAQVVVKAAAVSDYRPKDRAPRKVKKKGRRGETLELVSTPDILADLSREREGQILVGFAAETEDIVENARAKLFRKDLDLLAANDVSEPDSGFGVETNRVRIITTDGRVEQLPLLSKQEVAQRLWNRIVRLLPRRKG